MLDTLCSFFSSSSSAGDSMFVEKLVVDLGLDKNATRQQCVAALKCREPYEFLLDFIRTKWNWNNVKKLFEFVYDLMVDVFGGPANWTFPNTAIRALERLEHSFRVGLCTFKRLTSDILQAFRDETEFSRLVRTYVFFSIFMMGNIKALCAYSTELLQPNVLDSMFMAIRGLHFETYIAPFFSYSLFLDRPFSLEPGHFPPTLASPLSLKEFYVLSRMFQYHSGTVYVGGWASIFLDLAFITYPYLTPLIFTEVDTDEIGLQSYIYDYLYDKATSVRLVSNLFSLLQNNPSVCISDNFVKSRLFKDVVERNDFYGKIIVQLGIFITDTRAQSLIPTVVKLATAKMIWLVDLPQSLIHAYMNIAYNDVQMLLDFTSVFHFL